MQRWSTRVLSGACLLALLPACNYFRLLRPKALKQLNPDVVALVNEFTRTRRDVTP